MDSNHWDDVVPALCTDAENVAEIQQCHGGDTEIIPRQNALSSTWKQHSYSLWITQKGSDFAFNIFFFDRKHI